VTSAGWAATSASAVTAPPLLANISTGPAPSASITAWTSSAWTVAALSTRPSLRRLRPRPRGSYVTTVRSGKCDANVANPPASIG
jgi:hypothetical protein